MRRALGCRRPDLPRVAPQLVDVGRLTRRPSHAYQGRTLARGEVDELRHLPGADPTRPLESPLDGCPASWAGSLFAQSLAPYLRRRLPSGAREPNWLLDASGWQIRAAVAYFELEQDRAIDFFEQVALARLELVRERDREAARNGSRLPTSAGYARGR